MYDNTSYIKLVNFLSKKLTISYEAVYGYQYNISLEDQKGIFSKSKVLSFLSLMVFPLLIVLLLFKINKKNKIESHFTVEEWRNDSFSLYYKEIVEKFPDTITISRLLYSNLEKSDCEESDKKQYNVFYIKDYIDKKTLIKIFCIILNPKFLFLLLSSIVKNKNNVCYMLLKFLASYIKLASIASNLNTKIYLNANDINSHILKYELFKNSNIIYLLIQSSIRDQDGLKYKGGDIIYCYSEVQAKLYRDNTNNYQEIISIGSIKNNTNFNDNKKIYDILFVEQFGSRDRVYGKRADFIKMLKHLIKLSYEHPELNIIYRGRPEKRIQNNKAFEIYKPILSKLNKSNINIDTEGSSYEKVKKTKLVIGNISTLCFESIGLNVATIFFYYRQYNFELFDYNGSKDIVIRDDSYEVFKERVLYFLNHQENYNFEKYKLMYMNQNEDIVKIIADQIKKYIY